jgi:hypothetical protein
VWELAGELYDASGAGFQPDNALVDDLVFDEDSATYVGLVNCWKIIGIVSRHTPNYMSLVVQVSYNEPGSPGGVGEPYPGGCAICRSTSTGLLDLSQAPAPGFTLISDSLSNSIRNYDSRTVTSAGVQGPQGDLGTDGAQGFQGDLGTDGAQGFQGDLGTDGAQGPQGDLGTDGVQGFQGDLGTDGVQGPQGDLGTDGVQGFQGDLGTDGFQGPQGDLGTDGFQGFQGWQGDEGDPSTVEGPQGPQGFDGPQGFQGPQAVWG